MLIAEGKSRDMWREEAFGGCVVQTWRGCILRNPMGGEGGAAQMMEKVGEDVWIFGNYDYLSAHDGPEVCFYAKSGVCAP